jgi:RNA polymerase sigma-70 factor (ECF subfamily)
MSALSDRDLVLRVRRGEVDAFGDLVQLYQQSVFNVCYRLVGERREAEDMTQEAFIRAYERLNTFDADRPFGPWVRRVAANVCLNRLERKSLVRVPLDDEYDFPEEKLPANPEAVLEKHERAGIIRNALLALPPHYRAVIELRHFQDLEYEEIATALNLPMNTVKSHLFRARKILAERLHHV